MVESLNLVLDSRNPSYSKSRKDKWIIFSIICAAIISAEILSFFAVYHFIDGWEKRGQFGDIFGVTNSLFSGIAFSGIIFTILLQQEQVNDQREQAFYSRAESNEMLKMQNHSNDLSSITFLMQHYEFQLDKISTSLAVGPARAVVDRKCEELLEKRKALEKLLNDIHSDVLMNFGRR